MKSTTNQRKELPCVDLS